MSKKKKILLVEDEALAVMTMEDIFDEWGYDLCCVTSNGHDALQNAETCQLDVVIMDINLQGPLNGIETAAKLREVIDPVIIFITGYSASDYQEQVAFVKPLALLEKPLDFEKMHLLIEQST